MLCPTHEIPDTLDGSDANACEPHDLLLQSFSIASAQQAKSLQLRAAIRMQKLATTAASESAAYNLLSQVYDSFSEGFDTQDLLQARMLLDLRRTEK
jgi:hypothetical protein